MRKEDPLCSPGVSRREFIAGSAAAGLLLCLGLNGRISHASGAELVEEFRYNAFLEIGRDGVIQITTPTTEMGQGIHNSLPQIIAEELGADWNDVQVVMPHADPGFVANSTGQQRTAGSEAVRVYYEQLRSVGASAREMLCSAAAARWGVPAAECVAAGSRVVHTGSGRELKFGELAAAAAALSVPEQPKKKSPAQFTLIGKHLPRKDISDKVSGKTVFGIDVALPEMLYAALRMPPQALGKVARFDPASVMSRPGVHAVVEVDGGVAVIADRFWRAKKSAEALDVEFTVDDVAGVSTPAMRETLRVLLDDDVAAVPFPNVDTQVKPAAYRPLDRAITDQAIDSATQVLEMVYEVPYLAHLTMEPMVCTALVTADSCHVWAPTQLPDGGRELAAELTGLPLSKVRLDVTFTGGGFGRKWEVDTLRQSVQAAKAVPGHPVKLIWTREQDVQHDFYRPGFMTRTRVALDDNGITGMHSRIAGQSVWRFQGKPQRPDMADPTVAALLVSDLYDFPGKYIDFVEAPWLLPVGLWRSVTLSQNAFFAESAIDEAAVALGRDPYEFRREMLAAHPRIVAVLDAAAEAADWYRERPAGRGVGIAVSQGFGSLCVQVADVVVDGDRLHIEKMTCALDCGTQIDPDTIHAQLEGGMIFGLSAALRGEITFTEGAVNESNFHDQRILRIDEMPEFVVVLMDSDESPGGVGEAGVPPVAPALANAIHAASGRRLRRLPLSAENITLA